MLEDENNPNVANTEKGYVHLSETSVAQTERRGGEAFGILLKGYAEDHILVPSLPMFVTHVPAHSASIAGVSVDARSTQQRNHDTIRRESK